VEEPTVLNKTISLINFLGRKYSQTQDLAEFYQYISNIPMKLFTQDYWEGNTEFWILPLFCIHSCEQTVKWQGCGASLLADPAGAPEKVRKMR